MKSDNVPLHSEGRGGISQESNRKIIVLRKGRGLSVTNHIPANTWAAVFFIAELIVVIVDSLADPTQKIFFIVIHRVGHTDKKANI